MREFFRDGVDRRLKIDQPYRTPQLVSIPITADEVEAIVSSANPKGALRDFGRRYFASVRSRG